MQQGDQNVERLDTDATAVGSYVLVNGLNLYYEIHGSGAPLILLHGGVSASGVFGANVQELASVRHLP